VEKVVDEIAADEASATCHQDAFREACCGHECARTPASLEPLELGQAYPGGLRWPQVDADVLVIGAGAIGTSVAASLASRGHRVIVLEKEPGPGVHQSGRNSGVIHAGYNQKPGSSKAKFCVEGSRQLRAYCLEKGIAMAQGGILVVAQTEAETKVLDELHRRAKANGTDVRLLDEAGIKEVEPHAAGIQALQAREAASFDARAYVHALASDAMRSGATFLYDTRVQRLDEGKVTTDKGTFTSKVVVNAAGLYADVFARDLASDMRVIPFRGCYAEVVPSRAHLVKSHIYAAPDLDFPFLGVHLSRRADGRVIVGPGAMLAFGREAYTLWSLRGGGLGRTLGFGGFWRMMMRHEFRRLVKDEFAKSLNARAIGKAARLLVPELAHADLVRSFAGNRAQLVAKDGMLVDDIIVRETPRAVHVLNAVSPGLTCSLPFGEHLADLAERKLE
jgi:L-2-hydroxyglutarate oxidase